MEEHIWSLVELFISGEATTEEIDELTYLLGTHSYLLNAVKEFLDEYKDPDPQVTKVEKRTLIAKAKTIHNEFVHMNQPQLIRRKKSATGFMNGIRQEGRAMVQLFKTTYRQLSHNRTISFINITGLAIGMATAMLIFIWIANELSFDNFHVNRDRIYEVYSQKKDNGQLQYNGALPSRLKDVIMANYPQVEEVNRTSGVGSFVLKHGDKRFESKGLLSDANYFKFFTFPFAEGNPATALAGPYNIVLTQPMAEKLFGHEDPMGKIVKIDSNANFTVTGVLKPLPNNTAFRFFEYIVPLSYMKDVHWQRDDWATGSVNICVMLKPGVSHEKAQGLFWNVFRDQHVNPGTNGIVQPMADWWLYDNYENGKFLPGRLVMLRWFGLIAMLVLLIACINYMNLGTARSAKRAKEVGIRKVAGAGRGMLIRQFLGESVITAFAAGLFAIGLMQLAMPAFSKLIGMALNVPYGNPVFWLLTIGFILFTGIIAGSYPAFYLSAYRPARVLKGILSSAGALIAPRKIMVVVQFTLAISFIICTVVIYRQIDFALHRSKGYDTSNLAYVYVKGDINKNYEVIKHDLEESGTVTSLTRTNSPVIDIWTGTNEYSWQGKNPAVSLDVAENFTDRDFTRTTGIQLLQGRDIDVYRYPTDTAALLLTETAVKRMGLKQPVGQLMKKGTMNLHVVGVIKDFVTGWAYSKDIPIIIKGTRTQFGAINLRLNGKRTTSKNLASLNAVFAKYNPDYPFVCNFADRGYEDRMEGDENVGTIAATCTGLTIFISCMGLFALAAFMAENRIKEIGIRKVLGASVAGIATLLSKDFLILVGLAFIIASPIAWWLMNKWLSNYPLHIDIGLWVFILTGAASILIAIITVSFQALKAAMVNPIKNLRTE